MIEALLSLGSHDLLVLADAIRHGRLVRPFTDAGTSRVIAESATAANVAASLRRLDTTGGSCDVIVELLEAIARDRERRPRAEEAIDLVSTGPEAPGVTNRDTRIVVRELFLSAKKSVVVVGYAIYQGKQVFEALARRMDDDSALNVRLFLDVQRGRIDRSLSSEILRRFAHRFRTQEWPGTRLPGVYYDPRSLDEDSTKRSSLHAKCIIVDRSVAFISSANFTEAAQQRNVEVGALIRSASFAARVADHFDALSEANLLVRVPGL
jgi:phosphatidylserine/phosphatidylglycerophosphate/cardiolipin synthase-like enzyme